MRDGAEALRGDMKTCRLEGKSLEGTGDLLREKQHVSEKEELTYGNMSRRAILSHFEQKTIEFGTTTISDQPIYAILIVGKMTTNNDTPWLFRWFSGNKSGAEGWLWSCHPTYRYQDKENFAPKPHGNSFSKTFEMPNILAKHSVWKSSHTYPVLWHDIFLKWRCQKLISEDSYFSWVIHVGAIVKADF